MALVIAGERSGVGKTTVTLALLSFLANTGKRVQSFKVGPDYIDPMFHTRVTGRPCRNLDPVLTSEEYVRHCFTRHSQDADFVMVEGVMGLFDGISHDSNVEGKSNITDFASTAHIARLLDLPVLLVIDCSRLSGSVAAIAQGYSSLDPRVKIAGVVLNRVGSDRHLQLLQDALEPLSLPILGVFHRQDSITLPDRHLGLVPTEELPGVQQIFEQLAELAKNSFNWDLLLPLLQPSSLGSALGHDPDKNNDSTIHQSQAKTQSPKLPKIKIAIARDRAFNFYYADNLDLLFQFGAELLPWSPLTDETLPKGTQGLYFGGGFPEVFAGQLAQNTPALKAVKTAIEAGLPTYAECGGLMYLCDQIVDFAGQSWKMVGVLPTTAQMGKGLTLGYRQATALQNSLFVQKGETISGHEFHRSSLTLEPPSPLYQMQGYAPNHPIYTEGWHKHSLHASYLHVHWGECPHIPQRFVEFCHQFKPQLL